MIQNHNLYKTRFLLLLLLVLTNFHLSAQSEYPQIQVVEVRDRVFSGKIGEDPFTLYLSFQQYTPWHNDAYIVAGWYALNNTSEQVPLSGLYDRGELTLYHFSDKATVEEMFTIAKISGSQVTDIDYYKKLPGFDEKFVLTDGNGTLEDKNGSKTVSIKDKDLAIKKTLEYLVFNNQHAFDLQNLGMWHWNYQIIAQNGQKLILEYDHPSKRFNAGRCAAGTERGFIVVEFDDDYGYKESSSFVVESCLFSIEVQEEKELSNGVTEYHCENFLNSDAYTLLVDRAKAKIVKKGN